MSNEESGVSKRQQAKRLNNKTNAAVNSFIASADNHQSIEAPVKLCRPKKNSAEVTKSVTCALTNKEQQDLDGFAKKIDYLLIDDVKGNYTVTRSSVVKSFIAHLSTLSLDELVSFYKNNHKVD